MKNSNKTKKRKPSFMSKPVLSMWWWAALIALDIADSHGSRDYPFDMTVLVLVLIFLLIKSDKDYERM